jgi:hypothetical protein
MLLSWMLLLLTRLRLPAALLLLPGLLTRILVLLAGVALVLVAHSGTPLLKTTRANRANRTWLQREQRFPLELMCRWIGRIAALARLRPNNPVHAT